MPKLLVPRDPYLYVVQSGGGAIKVGCSVNPVLRAKQIAWQEGMPASLVAWVRVKRDEALSAERHAQWQLRDYHIRGEWFNVTARAAIKACNKTMANIDRIIKEPRKTFLGHGLRIRLGYRVSCTALSLGRPSEA